MPNVPNPTGMVPKRLAEKALREARRGMPSAFQTLHKACEIDEQTGRFKEDDVPWSARISAASVILDRCLGKPKQEITGTHTHEYNVGAEMLRAMEELARVARQSQVQAAPIDVTPEPPRLTSESANASKQAYVERKRAEEL